MPVPVLVGGACVIVPELGFAWILGRLQSAAVIVSTCIVRFALFVLLCAAAVYGLPDSGVSVLLGVGAAVLARLIGSLLSFNSSFGSADMHAYPPELEEES